MKIISGTLVTVISLAAAISFAQSNSSSLIETPGSPPKAADTSKSTVDQSTPSDNPSESECTSQKKKRHGKKWKKWNHACLAYKKHGRHHDGKHDDQDDDKNYEKEKEDKDKDRVEKEKEDNEKEKSKSNK